MKRETKLDKINRQYSAMQALGFTHAEIETLRRAQLVLHRWYELECGVDGGGVERDENTGKCFWYNAMTGMRSAIADRETGALRRVAQVMEKHIDLIVYHQTDPRGYALYILRRDSIRTGEDIDAIYNRGLAICY